MSDNKTITERLDEQDEKLEYISKMLEKVEFNSATIKQSQNEVIANTTTKQNSSKETILAKFLKNSQKEYLWFGDSTEFKKSKRMSILIQLALIIVGIISTITTTTAFGLYSTFTLFENIWLIASVFVLIHVINNEKITRDVDLMSHSCDIFETDKDGTWRNTGTEKKRYRVFRRISYACVPCNIVCILAQLSGSVAITAIIFEIIFLVLSICSIAFYSSFTCMYGQYIIYKGLDLSNKQTVSLVFDTYENKLFLFDDFKKKHSLLFE